MLVDFTAVERLLEAVAARLREEFPDAATLPDSELLAFLRPVLRRAALFGLKDEDSACTYALCAWLTGEDFASAFVEPRDICNSKQTAQDKAHALEDWLQGLIDASGT